MGVLIPEDQGKDSENKTVILFPGVRSQVAFLNSSGSSGTGEQPFPPSAVDPALPCGPTFLSVPIYPSHQRLELCPFFSLLPEALSNCRVE